MKYEHQVTTSEPPHSEDTWTGSHEHQEPDHLKKEKQPALNIQRKMLLLKCINKRKRIVTEEATTQPHAHLHAPQDTHHYYKSKVQITKKERDEESRQSGLSPRGPSAPDRQPGPSTPSKKTDVSEQDKELVEEFLEDNSVRYVKKRRISPVPVLPILVPAHLKGCLASGDYVSPTKEERIIRHSPEASSQDNDKENAPTVGPILDRNRIGRNSDEEAIHAALEHEQEVERRARDVQLRGNNTMNWTDPLLVAEYEEEIFAHLRETEMDTLPNPSYTSDDPNENEITWTTRDVLIDWVIEIHFLFQLLPETLFLTVNIIDRFLSKQRVSLNKLQLIGVTALLIATKFEEVKSPQLKDFLLMTGDKTLTEDDLITAEEFMLKVLDYKLCYSNPLNFLRRVSKTGGYDLHCRMLSKYLMEISCVDHRFIGIPPSKVAAASLWLAQRMLTSGTWTEEIARLAGYTAAEVKPAAKLMVDFLSKPVVHDAFFRKWSSRQLMMAGVFARSWVADRRS